MGLSVADRHEERLLWSAGKEIDGILGAGSGVVAIATAIGLDDEIVAEQPSVAVQMLNTKER